MPSARWPAQGRLGPLTSRKPSLAARSRPRDSPQVVGLVRGDAEQPGFEPAAARPLLRGDRGVELIQVVQDAEPGLLVQFLGQVVADEPLQVPQQRLGVSADQRVAGCFVAAANFSQQRVVRQRRQSGGRQVR